MDILSPFIQGHYNDEEEDNAEHCDDSQVVVIMMVMVRMMLLMRRARLIFFSTSGSKVFKLTVEILVREARGQVKASSKYLFFLPSIIIITNIAARDRYKHRQKYHLMMSSIVIIIAVVIIIINRMTIVFNLIIILTNTGMSQHGPVMLKIALIIITINQKTESF